MKNLAVLASGTGSILEAILADGVKVSLVLADRPCRALEIAEQAGVPTELVDRTVYGYAGPGSDWDRIGFTRAVIEVLQTHTIELVAMAGFMTVLDAAVFDAFPNQILNTHPSLLPQFKGDNAVQDALDADVKTTGCTIHYATADLDGGPIIVQEEVEVVAGDTKETLHERIKQVERRLYPKTLRTLMNSEQ